MHVEALDRVFQFLSGASSYALLDDGLFFLGGETEWMPLQWGVWRLLKPGSAHFSLSDPFVFASFD